jgi:hypothetical protein
MISYDKTNIELFMGGVHGLDAMTRAIVGPMNLLRDETNSGPWAQ